MDRFTYIPFDIHHNLWKTRESQDKLFITIAMLHIVYVFEATVQNIQICMLNNYDEKCVYINPANL